LITTEFFWASHKYIVVIVEQAKFLLNIEALMNHDIRTIFKNWLNSPNFQSKLALQFILIEDTETSSDIDVYNIYGLNSRLKWYVGRNSVNTSIDRSIRNYRI